jgi:hypothetical protein
MPDRTLERIRQAAMSSRSTLYRWLQRNHDGFGAALAEAGRPNWKAITAELIADGLTDADGKPPSQEAVRQTWWKVRKAVESARAKRLAPLPPPTPTVGPAITPSPSAGMAGDLPLPSAADAAPGAPKFRPARLRSHPNEDT